METRLRILFLATTLFACAGCSSMRAWLDGGEPLPQVSEVDRTIATETEEADEPAPRVIEPEVERRVVKIPRIDTENVEVGAFFGALSIEDFGTNPVYGVSAAYHITEDFFFRGQYGRSTAGRTSFETLGGNVQLLTDDERRFTYYSLSLGYNFLPGEVFLGRGLAMNSSFYLIGGIGGTEFADDEEFTVSFGAGYRVLPTDWLAVHIAVEDRVFESDLLGSSKLVNNLEAYVGATVFF
jgi:outer membrane beta-barrel protein